MKYMRLGTLLAACVWLIQLFIVIDKVIGDRELIIAIAALIVGAVINHSSASRCDP